MNFFYFAKIMRKKICQNLQLETYDHSKQSATDTLRTSSKREV